MLSKTRCSAIGVFTFFATCVLVGASRPAKAQPYECGVVNYTCNGGTNTTAGSSVVFGYTDNGGYALTGFTAATKTGTGVLGSTDDEATLPTNGTWGVVGQSKGNQGNNSAAVYGNATGTGGIGVLGTGLGSGVQGTTTSGFGVYGSTSGSNGDAGVFGVALGGSYDNGVEGQSGNASASGGYFFNTSGGYGVVGAISPAGAGTAVYGNNNSVVLGHWAGYFNGNLGDTGNTYLGSSLYIGGTCYAGPCLSDIRLKKNVQPLMGALDQLVKLRPVTFEWKEPGVHGPAGTQIGFIAQEVERVKPEWVGIDADGYKTLNMSRIGLDAMLVDSLRTNVVRVSVDSGTNERERR